jgi:hypothetical protein
MGPKKDKSRKTIEETLQGSGEASGAPPSSLASPAPGAGAPTRPRRKAATVTPVPASVGKNKAVDKPAAASGSGGGNPVPSSKKKAAMSANAKVDAGATTGRAKAPGAAPEPTSTIVEGDSTGGVEAEPEMPGLQSVSNSSESEDSVEGQKEELRFTLPGFSAIPINRQDFFQAAANPAASTTPSLASLLHPSTSNRGDPDALYVPASPHSTSTANPQGKGVLNTESVSHFFKPQEEDQRIFVSICANIDLFNEEIGASLLKFHPVYDPMRDNDPLQDYGAVDGLLPGKTSEETISLRDVVMRWELPHIHLYWERLEDGISLFKDEKPKHEDLLIYQSDKGPVYSLGSFYLERFAQFVLAAKQILDGLGDFLDRGGRRRFELDPNWQLLCLMEFNPSRNGILMAFSSLQFRLAMASKHIQKYLCSIQIVYGQEGLDVISSIESTRSSVRSNFGRDEPQVELAKLLARPDYGRIANTINAEARARVVEGANLEARTAFYKEKSVRADEVPLPESPAIVE